MRFTEAAISCCEMTYFDEVMVESKALRDFIVFGLGGVRGTRRWELCNVVEIFSRDLTGVGSSLLL
jgi:hypothetical protein